MKFRTCLLAICMVVVPAVAMFSHHVPATARRSVRTCVRGWLARLVPGSAAPTCDTEAAPESPPAGPGDAAPQAGSASGPSAPAMSQTLPTGGAPQDPFPTRHRSAAAPEATSMVTAAPGPVPAAVGAEPGRRLAELGAVAIECVALPGAAGRCLASCRVPLDPAGQLQRVFQAEGANPDEATGLLVNELLAWQRRMAERQARRGPDTAVDPTRL